MLSLDAVLASLNHTESIGQFKPRATYYPAMDWLLVLFEDVPYRADSLSVGDIDILWHPHENKIVGVKIWDMSRRPNGARILQDAGLLA